MDALILWMWLPGRGGEDEEPSRRSGAEAGNIANVLAALNIGAVILGVASGGLAASILALVLSGVLSILDVESGADIGLVIGIVLGLAIGGWMAGIRAKHSERFHGAVTGLVLAFLIMVIARLGESPATTWTILRLAVLAIVVSGSSGWLAGRRKLSRS